MGLRVVCYLCFLCLRVVCGCLCGALYGYLLFGFPVVLCCLSMLVNSVACSNGLLLVVCFDVCILLLVEVPGLCGEVWYMMGLPVSCDWMALCCEFGLLCLRVLGDLV